MGWVTYDDNGNLVKYYKKPGPAKAAVTRSLKSVEVYGYTVYPNVVGCCSYRDFEGVLLGLQGAELKMWQFCNTPPG
jgi:hypothetical protein